MDNQEKIFNGETRIASIIARIGASIIDAIVLGVLGLILGSIFYRQFVQLAWIAKLIGFAIILAYFTLFNSKYLKGQSVGQKILSLKVVKRNGEYLEIKESFFRSLCISLLILINNWNLPIYSMNPIYSRVFGFVLFSLILFEVYFIIFNVQTRQSLHDLLVKSYVIKQLDNKMPVIQENRKLVLNLAFIPIILAVGITILIGSLANNEIITNLVEVQKTVKKVPNNYYSVNVSLNKNMSTGISTIVIIAYSSIEQNEDQINDVARAFFRDSKIRNSNNLAVIVRTGYDIGIASSWKTFSTNLSMDDWAKRLN